MTIKIDRGRSFEFKSLLFGVYGANKTIFKTAVNLGRRVTLFQFEIISITTTISF